MAHSKHVGKALIKIRDANGDFWVEKDMKQVSFDANKSYIVIGGLRGMGLVICFWLVRKGARNLVITSRTGIKGGGLSQVLYRTPRSVWSQRYYQYKECI